MKIHLRILLGPDRRYQLIKNTIDVCDGYFDSIGVLNAGPDLFYKEIRNILPEHINVIHHPDFFDIECARRHLIADVPENDWVLWLDGDETPSPMFLDNMKKMVTECEFNKKNVVVVPWYLHMSGKQEHEYNTFFETLASRDLYEFLTTKKHYFAPKRFIKNVKNKYVQSNWGAHELYKLVDEQLTYYGYIVNHYKSFHDWSQSPVWHLFMNPLVHNMVTKDQVNDVLELPIYKKVIDLKIKYNVYTSSDFIENVIDNNDPFLKEFVNIFNELEHNYINLHDHSDNKNVNRLYQLVKKFVDEYKFDFKLNPSYYCGNVCCTYKNKII